VADTLPAVLFVIQTPATNERSPRYMEKALAAIHQSLTERERVTFAYAGNNGQVMLVVECRDSAAPLVRGPLLANYPEASIHEISPDESPLRDLPGWTKTVATIHLERSIYPILRHGQFEDLLARRYADPIESLLSAVAPDEHCRCRIEFSVARAARRRCQNAKEAVELLGRSFFLKHRRLAAYYVERIVRSRPGMWAKIIGIIAAWSEPLDRFTSLETSATRTHEREADIQGAAEKIGGHLFDVRLTITVEKMAGASDDSHQRVRSIFGALGAFTRNRLAVFRLRQNTKRRANHEGMLLSHEELATLWHPPTTGTGEDAVQASSFTERRPPVFLPNGTEPGAVVLGRTLYRQDNRSVGLLLDDRRRHQYVIGKTGMGKTTMLLNQIHTDLKGGRGLCLIDPHGDLAEAATGLVPPSRTDEVIVFDAGDREYAVGFNPLACPDPSRIDLVASGVVSAMRKLYDSWGPRLEDTLRNAVHAAIEHRGTLLTVLELLSDADLRERLTARIENPVVRSFWQKDFASWSSAYRTEAVAAIQNKIRPFLTNSLTRDIVSQSSRTLDLRQVMDEGKILLANLSKGRIGEDCSNLLGALLVTSLQQAAMSRADHPEDNRRDFFVYVDEFQNFTTGAFETILSEARKYRLSLTICHQYRAQLDQATAVAIAGNVGTIVSFAVGSEDTEWVASTLSRLPGQILPHEVAGLPKHTAMVRPLLDGMPSDPFTIRMLPPLQPDEIRRNIIVRQSRRQYGVERKLPESG